MPTKDLIVAALATYRIARLVAQEEGPFELAQKLRNVADPDQATWIGRGLQCPWCISFWIGPVAVLTGRTKAGSVITQGMAVSALVGLSVQCSGIIQHYINQVLRRSHGR